MENYPVYKKLLKSGGTPLPNDTEVITVCFNTLFIGRDLSRGPLTVGMRLIWFTLPYPPAAQSSPSCHCLIYSVSVCDDCVLASTEDEGRERERDGGEKTCSQTCLCFHFSGIKREASLCYSSDPTWLRNEIKKEKGEMEGSSSPSWCCWGIVYSADKGDIRCLSLLREQCYCWMSQKEQEDSQ